MVDQAAGRQAQCQRVGDATRAMLSTQRPIRSQRGAGKRVIAPAEWTASANSPVVPMIASASVVP